MEQHRGPEGQDPGLQEWRGLPRLKGLCAAEHDLDVHAIGDLDPHQLPEGALIGVEVDEPLVDPHLPVVDGLASLSVRALPAGYLQLLGRQGDGPADVHSGPLGDPLDLGADTVDLCGVGAAERDSCALRHLNH